MKKLVAILGMLLWTSLIAYGQFTVGTGNIYQVSPGHVGIGYSNGSLLPGQLCVNSELMEVLSLKRTNGNLGGEYRLGLNNSLGNLSFGDGSLFLYSVNNSLSDIVFFPWGSLSGLFELKLMFMKFNGSLCLGITTLPSLSSKLQIFAHSPTASSVVNGISSEVKVDFDNCWNYNLHLTVNKPTTKAIAVKYSNPDINSQNLERFVVFGTGKTYMGEKIYVGGIGQPILHVDGLIATKEVIVSANNNDWTWPDYVFSNEYNLMSTYEVETFIKLNKHLPGIKSEMVIRNEGVKLAEMQVDLLKKVEELTLYIIELQKQVDQLKQRN